MRTPTTTRDSPPSRTAPGNDPGTEADDARAPRIDASSAPISTPPPRRRRPRRRRPRRRTRARWPTPTPTPRGMRIRARAARRRKPRRFGVLGRGSRAGGARRTRGPPRRGHGYASADEAESTALESTSVEGVFDATSLPPPPTVSAAWAAAATGARANAERGDDGGGGIGGIGRGFDRGGRRGGQNPAAAAAMLAARRGAPAAVPPVIRRGSAAALRASVQRAHQLAAQGDGASATTNARFGFDSRRTTGAGPGSGSGPGLGPGPGLAPLPSRTPAAVPAVPPLGRAVPRFGSGGMGTVPVSGSFPARSEEADEDRRARRRFE